MNNILITGFKGCGKTTVGKGVARQLRLPFIDLDWIIEDIYKLRYGRPSGFREIYQDLGEEGFREMEAEAAESVACYAATPDRRYVISLGGGAMMNDDVRHILGGLGTTIFLRAPFEDLIDRIHQDGMPAYVETDCPETELLSIFREREPVFLKHADRIVNIEGLDAESALAKTLEAIGGGTDG